MANRGSSSDKKKQIALALLGVGLIAAVIYQIYFTGPSSRPKRPPQPGAPAAAGSSAQTNSATPAASKTRQLGSAAQQEAMMQALLSDTTPLNLSLTSGGKSAPGIRGNIFGYYKEPPKKPDPPPPPPPIQLISLQPQTAVAGTPKPVTIVINGNKIPADAHILIDGSPRPTKRISETQLSTEISAGDYTMARGMTFEVRSKSDPAQNSNTIQFVVQQAPEPQFIYKGRLGSLGQPLANYAVVEITSTRETKRIKVGDTIMGVWRVDSITADGIEVTLTQYGIKRRVQLQDRPK